MNCLNCCVLPAGEQDARGRSHEIDVMLKRDIQSNKRLLRIMLTGTCECGISAFLRLVRLNNKEEFSHNELLEFREAIYENVIQGMQVLIQERTMFGTPWQNPANEVNEILVRSVEICGMHIEPCTFQHYVSAIVTLWKDFGIQETYKRRSEFQLCESVQYFINNIHRIGQLNYLPSSLDILYAHKSTKSIEDHYFVLEDMSFMISDVGDLFFRKPKLSHYFNDITFLLFIASSIEFDHIRIEDDCTNSLVESLIMFETTVNNKHFFNTSIILFLNKSDLLEEKVRNGDIRKDFPEFQGDPHRLENVQAFLVQCFRQRLIHSQMLFHHFTTTVNKQNIWFVFHDVKATIMQLNLKRTILI
ncbi:guanine nucleotide-binding protein subunit alpha-12-like [Xyrauchen texanus]|uniref:guanine nucleotide-binding protein subunit alpha-12-like n=1 Tax=Xyrauchen texanus TaxID=154827 RepID=UPI002242225B|nr:guanine nucleotide-binding protein subunit alpha-12-like [Xyrauchen texanus]